MGILHFLIFLFFGIILGILYDILKISRNFYQNNTFIFIIDILYFAIYFIIMFKMSIILNFEKIRYYMVLECYLGFIVYKLTISRFIFLAEKNIAEFIKKRHLIPKIKLFILHKKMIKNKK